MLQSLREMENNKSGKRKKRSNDENDDDDDTEQASGVRNRFKGKKFNGKRKKN